MLKLYVAATNLVATSKREDGQTMAEYGVVLAVITLLVIGALTALSTGIQAALQEVAEKVTPL